MIRVAEFSTGQLSVPGADADDLPECCFACAYLAYKEFSVGDGAFYYFCGCPWQAEISLAVPACEEEAAPPGVAHG
jgi:hypothetical protein